MRANDPDRFLISLAFPVQQREALWAVFAFNYEIAKTREVVSEPTLGHIRLKWWEEGVDELEEGRKLRHEVLTALAPLKLPKAELKALIAARDFDLSGKLPQNIEELQAYAVATAVPLARLAARVTGGDPEEAADAAVAYSLTGLIRSVPALTAQQRCFLPADLIAKAGFTEYDLYAHKAEPDALATVIAEIAKTIPAAKPRGRYLKACAAVSRLYIRQLERAGWNPVSASLAAPPLFFPIRVLWASR